MGKQIRITAPTAEGAILRLLDVCNATDIATAVDLFIERLDKLDGDPDLEPNGDDLDGCFAEDDFCDHSLAYPGPGCPVSDGGCATGSGAGDPSWTEWQYRGRFKVGKHGEEQCRRSGIPNMAHEDDEDDDPREANGDEQDTGNSEEEELTLSARNGADAGPGCQIGDPGGCGQDSEKDFRPIADPQAYRAHRDRIRRTRCDRVASSYYGGPRRVEYRLKSERGYVGPITE